VSTTAKRGPYAKTAGRIEHILDVALELFAAGYQAVTMKEIAERAGLSQPGLMHHFPTKADILIALLRRHDERSPAPASEAPPLDQIMAIVDHVYDDRFPASLHSAFLTEATSPDHPAHQYFKERYDTVIRRTTTAFTTLERQGRLQDGRNPATLARMLIGLLDGLQVQWLYDPDSVDIKDAVHTFLASHST
jgi:AcrR family transcriptional regulator